MEASLDIEDSIARRPGLGKPRATYEMKLAVLLTIVRDAFVQPIGTDVWILGFLGPSRNLNFLT